MLDRDGTIVIDVPYNGNPDLVAPAPGARVALARLRGAGLLLAVVSNQSGVGRGLISASDVERVNRRVDDILGPFDGWFYCPHAPDEGCECRKPRPGLLLKAAHQMGIGAHEIVVLGDKESDMEAARNAGMRGILINGARTLTDAVNEILGPAN